MDDLIKNGIQPSQKARKKRQRDDAFISGIFPTSIGIRSPRDETPIVMNGKIVDLESQIEARISRVSPVIKPVSPVQSNFLPLQNVLSTPAVLPYNEVNIVESPKKDLEEQEITPAVNTSMDFSSLLLQKKDPSPVSKPQPVSIPAPPIISFPKIEAPTIIKSEMKPPVVEIVKPPPPNHPVIKALVQKTEPTSIPAPIMVSDNEESKEDFSSEDSDSPKSEISSKSSELESEDSVETMYEERTPLPIFSFKQRASSPIETLNAPKSPSPRIIDQNEESANNTPALTPINATPNKRVSMTPPILPQVRNVFNRAPSPPIVKHIDAPSVPSIPTKTSPQVRIPSPVRPRSPVVSPPKQNYISVSPPKQPSYPPPTYIPPQYQQSDEHMIYGYGRPDYSRLTPEQEAYLKTQFKVKFGTLRANYPQWGIVEIHDSFTLDQINDLYSYYIRQIMVSKETGTYKVYLVIFFMIIEVIGVKILKLNMSGYTMSQLRRMNQYDALLTELGEKWLVGGGSEWPIEARLLLTASMNAVIFLGVKYLCGWMGVEGLSDTIQNFFDSMINGPEAVSKNNIPAAAPMNMNLPRNTTATTGEEQQQSNNPLDSISSVIGNLFGGNKSGGDTNQAVSGFADTIAQLGTMFTSKMQNANKTAAANPKPAVKQTQKPPMKKKLNKKSLFSSD